MRTQKEIRQRFIDADDMFGTVQGDLIHAMTFEVAKEFLKEEYVKEVESGEKKWQQLKDTKKEILGYLGFAYDKADNQRGLSANRSMLHFEAWIWLDDADFYEEIKDLLTNYTNYGIPALDKIAAKYGYTR